MPKSADLYLILLKVAPAAHRRRLAAVWRTASGTAGVRTRPQSVYAEMAGNGANGAINFSHRPLNYGYDVKQVNQISQGYSAGVDLTATGSLGGGLGANAGAKFDIRSLRVSSEDRGRLEDLIYGKIQSKGYFQKQYSVTSNYTVTVYNWQMAVTGGAVNENDNKMMWDLVTEENEKETTRLPQYFLAVQVPQGKTGHIQELSIAGAFENDWWIGFGESKGESTSSSDITFEPRLRSTTERPDFDPADAGRPTVGECSNVQVVCNEGKWMPDTYESGSEFCDGLDNDCDGSVDEDVFQYSLGCRGEGVSVCANGLSGVRPRTSKCDGRQQATASSTSSCEDLRHRAR